MDQLGIVCWYPLTTPNWGIPVTWSIKYNSFCRFEELWLNKKFNQWRMLPSEYIKLYKREKDSCINYILLSFCKGNKLVNRQIYMDYFYLIHKPQQHRQYMLMWMSHNVTYSDQQDQTKLCSLNPNQIILLMIPSYCIQYQSHFVDNIWLYCGET